MDDVYNKIQVYLIKKNKDCEPLKFLTSRTTASNTAQISEICKSIKNILENDRTGEEAPNAINKKCIQHFKFFLLNTNFKTQEYLCEDIVNGHLVDMCPPLSPYLFIEILWTLNYDEILCNSILYIPMDLCTEILDILCRCLDLDFQRALNIVLNVVTSSYKKLVLTTYQNTQILDKEESLKRFGGSIQELLSLLTELPSRKTEGLPKLSKYERHGWIIIKLLNMIRECLTCRRSENIPPIESENFEKLYKVTFGRNFMDKLDSNVVAETVDIFSNEFIDLLLGYVKKIDCNVYLGWAELDYIEDTSMTMQRAVGLACYHFVSFLKDSQNPEEYSHVIECLQQLSSQPDAAFSMSLQELCTEVEKGNRKCLVELIGRFKDWDTAAISCLEKNQALIEKNECLSLLNNVVELLEISLPEEEFYTKIYGMVTKVLLNQKLVTMVEIIIEFILIHNASRALECLSFESYLKSYINQGVAVCSDKTSLRIIFFFVIQNPREVLKILIKAAIGYPEYANSVVLSENFCNLSPVMKINDTNNLSLLSNALIAICCENISWNSKRFADLIHVLLKKNILSADNILNDIFIPCLKNDIILTNVRSILTCIRTIHSELTSKVKKHELLYALALKMTALRKNNTISMYSKEEVLNLLIRTVQHFAKEQIYFTLNGEANFFVQKLEAILEPLDEIYFAPQWGWSMNETSLDQVSQDYKRRCYYVTNEFPGTYNLTTETFLQHLILQCTEFEYLRFAKEMLIIHWNYFGWKNEVDAYTQLALTTIKVCSYYLEIFDLISSWELVIQKFSSLIKCLGKLTKWFISIDIMNDYESVYKGLVIAINALNLSKTIPPDLRRFYEDCKTNIQQSVNTTVYSYEMIEKLVRGIDQFSDLCLQYCGESVANTEPRSISALNFYINWTFISICLNWPRTNNHLMLSKIDKKLYPICQNSVQTDIAQ